MKAILISLKPNKKTNQTEIRLKSSLSKESTIYNLLFCAYDLLGYDEEELQVCLKQIKEDRVEE